MENQENKEENSHIADLAGTGLTKPSLLDFFMCKSSINLKLDTRKVMISWYHLMLPWSSLWSLGSDPSKTLHFKVVMI